MFMFERARVPTSAVLQMIIGALVALAVCGTSVAAPPAPTAHHPGLWTSAAPWPGRSASNSVWAVHMGLVRGDTLFARPHSRVLAWGNWAAPNGTDGGVWSWNPKTNVASDAAQNLVEETDVPPPPLNAFCAGHTALASGDFQIVGGTNRNIAGEKLSARFAHQTKQWESRPLQQRRWYANATSLPDGRVLATAGLKYDHMVLFGGRKQTGNTLLSDVKRYAISATGDWDPALTSSGADWPEPREHHTMADQPMGPYYLFGGRGVNELLRDFWQLKISDDNSAESYTWAKYEWPSAFATGSSRPGARWRHVAVVDPLPTDDPGYAGPDRFPMYVYGGDDGATPLFVFDDLWKLEWVATPQGARWRWTQLTNATGTPPGARTGATAAWDNANNRMILFGGEGPGGVLANNNVYILRFGGVPDWKIAPLAAGSATPPTARTLHAMGADFKRRQPTGSGAEGSWFHAVIFGGQTAAGLSNELFELFVEPGTDAVKWIARTPPAGTLLPEPRKRASLIVYDEYPGSAVVLGGERADSSWDAAPWEIELLDAKPWGTRGAPADALRGQTAFCEQRALTALRPEIYDPVSNSWSTFGPSRWQTSYHLIGLGADGMLYQSGANSWGTDVTWRLDPLAPTPTWSVYENSNQNPLDDAITGLLYRPDRLIKCGGTDNASPGVATNLTTSKSMALGIASPAWKLAAEGGMVHGRGDHNVNLLPTGEVIVTGGTGRVDDADSDSENDSPRKQPEIWDPAYLNGNEVGYWYGARSGSQQLAASSVTRSHHSSSVLLPDGRILTGGGQDGHLDAVRRAADQYSPPHLFLPGTAPDTALRPRLLGAQDHITYATAVASFKVACPQTVVEACLIRPGASTHGFNQDNRYISLTLSPTEPQTGHRVTLLAPANANIAPPGNYLLFVLRDDGGRKVPSIARWVNVGNVQTNYATWDITPPDAVTNLAVVNVSGTSQTVQWTAPADAPGDGSILRSTRYELRYRAGAPMSTLEEFFTVGTRVDPALLPVPTAAGTIQSVVVPGLAVGMVYHFRLISRDGAGSDRNWSAMSNEALTPTGGGGCPFVDTRTAAGWEVENSILGRSLSGAMALDGYRLRFTPEVANGRVRFRVRENEQELTTLDQLRLIAVDHAPSVRAYAVGDRVVLGSRVPASRVTTSAGVDITALVNGIGDGFKGGPGDTLLVEFGGAAATAAQVFGADATTSHDPFLEGDGGKCPPDCSPLRSPDIFSVTGVDAQVLSQSGIRIQAQAAGGEWQTVATRYPREYLDEVAMEEVGHGPLRVVFVGRHAVHFLGRLVQGGGEFTARKLPLLAAAHTRFGDVAAAVDSIGNLTTELAPGDTVHLEFGWEPVAEGQVRELLLLSHGVYTANLPAKLQESPTLRFSIQPWQPNPFAGSAMLRFALPESRQVRLQVLDAQGRRVRLLANHSLPAGSHSLEWDGRNEAGARVGAGIYFYQFQAGEHRSNGRLALVP